MFDFEPQSLGIQIIGQSFWDKKLREIGHSFWDRGSSALLFCALETSVDLLILLLS